MTIQLLLVKIKKVNIVAGNIASWFNILLVVLVGFDVLFRYLLNTTSVWVMELEWHFFALIFLLGGGFAFQKNQHVRVDVFYEKFSAKEKAEVNFWGGIIFLVPWTLFLLYTSYSYAQTSFLIRESSPDPGGLPARYLIKYAIFIGFLLLLIEAVISIFENGILLFKKQIKK
jgi:TRAP-type mannitol/chloroaromatic compound transport system permease small subunit